MNPGIYDNLSNAAYHAENGYISCSMLKAYLPEHYRPFTGSNAADIGTALHTRVLGGPSEPIVTVPFKTWQGKEAQSMRQQAQADGCVAILDRDVQTLDLMEKSLRTHSDASQLLFSSAGQSEVSVFTSAEQTGVRMKARLDRLNDDGTAVDVKTFSGMLGRHALTRRVIDLGYDIQRLHYTEVATAAGLDIERFVFVFVSTDAPHPVCVVQLDESFTDRAEQLRALAIDRLMDSSVEQYEGQQSGLRLSVPSWARLD